MADYLTSDAVANASGLLSLDRLVIEPATDDHEVALSAEYSVACKLPESTKRILQSTLSYAGRGSSDSKASVDRLAFEREHAKHAFVHAIQRLTFDKPLQRFQSQRELTNCERLLCT